MKHFPRPDVERYAPLAASVAAIVVITVLAGRGGTREADAASPAAQPVASPHGDLRVECEACHTANSWKSIRKPLRFDHATTGFPLAGRHAAAACEQCHKSPVFSRVATSCVDCHRDVHEGRMGTSCQDCHSPERWTARADAVRQHASAGFPLQGVHALLECSRCHGGTGEKNVAHLSPECASCHAAEYAAARNPDHAASGFSTRCETCHDASRLTWGGSGFDHASTGFPLTGAHRSATCQQCHTSGTLTHVSPDCYSCHQTQFANTSNPNHQSAGFGTQCATCHTTSSWAGAVFDHSRTAFSLTGAHQSAACTACHAGGRFAGTPTDCSSCHQTQYASTSNPNHQSAGFGTQCATCHNTTSWAGAVFDHNSTAFPLTGAHQTAACNTCHGGGRYAGTPTDCFSCHQTQYAATTNPNHQAAGFGTACASCHSTSAWQPANFNHDQFFRISSGSHAASCATCHTNPASYASFTCFQCHTHNQATTDAQHQGRTGYRYDSNACYSCHRR